ncbi:D-alanyl-D-alanine carboxypeptidase/D-alanyl-D-alanine-endopeptidase [Sporosarcina sp. P21c]|uniref:D-alanyl-D-alanine carboxypeptidase/D-alanyl-D-alanine endopeptidase n=1 Tax=Sporosarcina TaxID=1569 RepID=UPI000A167FED|nr:MULTISPECIES: D-alanyl-D-alanine carboxypeptidase/D-alanyl-D-alanine-endopeptidase [Sporosarcina]ARJ38663.1 D-alanyl-D-alanine carboxypeptidase [Sporosarcina ureae]PIC67479.1 D-alanyl-D-alanine carboxypeptidase/D-alanyl-D-alanine-endopeptidase [Sporosarcina sp. P16a]PIC89734.1 D-alanyl-D-alanine carboxypeptidase/D-alanyl-D-alanine-endopeptidase [Sporosarcina sp. P21c]PIC92930.1 D-alanyl-D-alanine carboxypeptidase/D-alanyl-D-alanine-endopeptidase [Sporosarcina sp. P25]
MNRKKTPTRWSKWLLGAMLLMASVTTPIIEGQAAAAQQSYKGLEIGINQVMSSQRMRGTRSSVIVREADTNRIVYQYRGNQGVTPASNVKVLTSTSALEVLGKDYTFDTDVLTNGTVKNGILDGHLYLRGTGDPTLLESDLLRMARQMRESGIRSVTGHIVADDTWFDTQRLSPGIHKSDETYYYAAQVSALTISPNKDYDAGTTIVEAKPTRNGKAGAVTLTPHTDIVKVVNRTRTVPKNQRNTVTMKRQQGTNTIIVSGNVPLNSNGKRQWVTVSNPTAYTADVFKRALAKEGIKLQPTARVTRGKTPASAELLAKKESMSLYYLMMPFMKYSNNSHAEILAKSMGRAVYNEGSWNAGLRVVRETLEKNSISTKGIYLEDGSGMSHKNKIPSEKIAEVLYAAQSKEWYPAFERSLPIAGVNDRMLGGTLRNRLTSPIVRGKVQAKTGSLNGTDSLSGYVKTKSGQELIFSILTENVKGTAKPDIDKMVQVMAAQ